MPDSVPVAQPLTKRKKEKAPAKSAPTKKPESSASTTKKPENPSLTTEKKSESSSSVAEEPEDSLFNEDDDEDIELEALLSLGDDRETPKDKGKNTVVQGPYRPELRDGDTITIDDEVDTPDENVEPTSVLTAKPTAVEGNRSGEATKQLVHWLVIMPNERVPARGEVIATTDDERDVLKDKLENDRRWDDDVRETVRHLWSKEEDWMIGVRRALQHQRMIRNPFPRLRFQREGASVAPPWRFPRPLRFSHETILDHWSGSAHERVLINHLSAVQCMELIKCEYLAAQPLYFIDENRFIKDLVDIPDLWMMDETRRRKLRYLRLGPGQSVLIDDLHTGNMSAGRRRVMTIDEVQKAHEDMVSLVRTGLPEEVASSVVDNLRACDPRHTSSSTTAWRSWKKRWVGQDPAALTFIEYEIIRCFNMGNEDKMVTECLKKFNIQFYRKALIVFIGNDPLKPDVLGTQGGLMSNPILTVPTRKTNVQRELMEYNKTGRGSAINIDESDDEDLDMMEDVAVDVKGGKSATVVKGRISDGAKMVDGDLGAIDEKLNKIIAAVKRNDAAVDIQARENEMHRIADLEVKLEATKADLARERDRSREAIDERDKMQKVVDGILRRGDGYYRVSKTYVTGARYAAVGIGALALLKVSPAMASVAARWSAPKIQRLGQWMADQATEVAQTVGPRPTMPGTAMMLPESSMTLFHEA